MPVTGSNIETQTYKCALVPKQYFDPAKARAILVETIGVDDSEEVAHVDIPYYNAVFVFARQEGQGTKPELLSLLYLSESIPEHNKIVASYVDGRLYLVVAEERKMLLCNSFKAIDFTTAEYFIFLALRKFQLNPEMSTIYFRSELTSEQEMSLYNYFRDVDQI